MPAGLKRRADWADRLAAFVTERAGRAFEWGANDCAMFAADWVLDATGTDPAKRFRGLYDSEEGATTILAPAGLEGLATEALGPAMLPKFAARGDIVLIEQANGPTLAVVGLDGRNALAPGRHRLEQFPMDRWAAAWRIG